MKFGLTTPVLGSVIAQENKKNSELVLKKIYNLGG
jgi:hypothetical protein